MPEANVINLASSGTTGTAARAPSAVNQKPSTAPSIVAAIAPVRLLSDRSAGARGLDSRTQTRLGGGINAETLIELQGGLQIVSIITKSSTERLNLSQGKDVYDVIKASDVIIATDETAFARVENTAPATT